MVAKDKYNVMDSFIFAHWIKKILLLMIKKKYSLNGDDINNF